MKKFGHGQLKVNHIKGRIIIAPMFVKNITNDMFCFREAKS
jgi:hypothetical protein